MTRARPVRTHNFDWLFEAEPQRQTAGASIPTRDIATDTTRTVSTIFTKQVDELRYEVRTLTTDIDDAHQRSYMNEWQVRTQQRTERRPVQMLEQLADLGFAWRDIARLVGVSVPAIQKWRKGGSTTPDNRHKLASLVAGCDLIERHRSIDDIAQWFEMPLIQGVPVTPLNLWGAGEYVLVFEYALQHFTAENVLDRFEPEWRERYRTNFETFRGEDGHLGIRVRER